MDMSVQTQAWGMGTQEGAPGEWRVASRGGKRDGALWNCSLYVVRKVTGNQDSESRKAKRKGIPEEGVNSCVWYCLQFSQVKTGRCPVFAAGTWLKARAGLGSIGQMQWPPSPL